MKKWLILFALLLLLGVSCESMALESMPQSQQTTSTTTKVLSQTNRESYLVPAGSGKASRKQLTTVKSWTGTNSRAITYNASKAPWVVNAGYARKGDLGTKFDVQVLLNDNGIKVDKMNSPRGVAADGTHCFLMMDSGSHTIEIDAAGCEWWVKIGVE